MFSGFRWTRNVDLVALFFCCGGSTHEGLRSKSGRCSQCEPSASRLPSVLEAVFTYIFLKAVLSIVGVPLPFIFPTVMVHSVITVMHVIASESPVSQLSGAV